MARRLTGIARPVGLVLLAGVCLSDLSCGARPDDTPASVTLALVNGRIWTGDPTRPWVDALAVSNGRIAAVGASDAIELLAGDAEVIDVRRRLVLPGFIDTHTDLLDLGVADGALNLGTSRSRSQLVTPLAAAAADRPSGAWVIGRAWDQRLWGGELPHRDWIDPVTPDHPVWLAQRDRQMGLANSRALAEAGIVAGTSGARTTDDAQAEPALTGILTGLAMRRLEATAPAPPPAAREPAPLPQHYSWSTRGYRQSARSPSTTPRASTSGTTGSSPWPRRAATGSAAGTRTATLTPAGAAAARGPGSSRRPEDVAVDDPRNRSTSRTPATGASRPSTASAASTWPRGMTSACRGASPRVRMAGCTWPTPRATGWLCSRRTAIAWRYGAASGAPGEFDTPLGLALGHDGLLYVADSGNQRVQWLDDNGAPAGGLDLGNAAHPRRLAA